MSARFVAISRQLRTRKSEETEKDKQFCKAESDEAYKTILKNQEEYDKQLLTLSTGLLAVVIAFLKDVVHLDSSVYLIFLYLGLLCLGWTICCVISSFQVSIRALESVRDYFKKRYEGNTDYPFPEYLIKRVRTINIVGGISFIAGVALIIFFIITNLVHQSRPKDQTMKPTSLQEGAPIKTPLHSGDGQRGSTLKLPIQPPTKNTSIKPISQQPPKVQRGV